MRMFAGPNGSGKSTIKGLLEPGWLGVYLNADDFEKELREAGRVDLSPFKVTTSTAEIREHCRVSGHLRNPLASWTEDDTRQISVVGEQLIVPGKLNSYLAATIVDFLRERLLQQKESFSFETVMSHRSKVQLLDKAQQLGFRTYLYFVATDDPEINIARVAQRVKQRGHDVPPDKVRERYQKSLELLREAVSFSNRAYIFDNSGEESVLEIECTNGGSRMEIKAADISSWVEQALLTYADEQGVD